MSNIEEEHIIENLKDAGFSQTEVKEFIDLYENSDLKEQCKCLEEKRKKLLNNVHENEKNITCLDYLKYSIENKNKKEEKHE